jgi:predicted DNA-binding transcriptional regulator AlpA
VTDKGETPKFMTPAEVQEALRISRRQFYELTREGEFGEVLRLGAGKNAHIRVSAEAFRAFVDRNTVSPAETPDEGHDQTQGEHEDVRQNISAGGVPPSD